MKPQLIEVEKEMTVAQLLEQEGLSPNKYIVDVGGQLMRATDTLKVGTQAKVIPAIKGG